MSGQTSNFEFANCAGECGFGLKTLMDIYAGLKPSSTEAGKGKQIKTNSRGEPTSLVYACYCFNGFGT